MSNREIVSNNEEIKVQNWRDCKLGDVADILSGYAFKSKDFVDEGIPVIKIKNIVPPIIDVDDVQYVTEELYDEKNRYALNYNDILISMTGSNVNQIASAVGKIGRVRLKNTKLLLNQRVGKLYITDKDICDYNYLYYYLTQEDVRYNLAASAGGSANQANISPSQIKNIKIKLPDLKEQKFIAHILSTLDEKIETNNEINKKLEETAQAIFKQWFVDFDFPNEEGEPYKSSGGEMVESEMGMIPKGWAVVKLSELGNVVTGKTPSTKQLGNFGDKYNFITPRDINNLLYILKSERLLSESGTEKLKTIKIKKNSIGVSCIGSNLGEVYINAEDGFTNQQINSLVLHKEELYPYVFIILKNMKEDFLNLAGGSAVPIINKTTFSSIKIIKPNEEILYKFVNVATNLFDSVKLNLIENNYLIEMRDNLLPKLMSGEIRVDINN